MQTTQSPAAVLPNLNTIKGVLFDIDGTLCNSDHLHFKVFQDMLLEEGVNGGVPIDELYFQRHISGRSNPLIMSDIFPHWETERQRQWSLEKEERFRRLAAGGLDAMPGLTEFLSWLDRGGRPSAAVTNAPRLNAEVMLGGLGLMTYFKGLVIGEECARPKPYPDPYLEGLSILGARPEEVIVVEDSPSGIAAGVAAGIAVVGITSGHPAEALRAAGACHTIDSYHDLLQLAVEQQVATAS